ncbi:uncharacterized protein LOC6559888 [Drosophila grimshawi]|uniref:GH19939 n=1 Tax=Drosophila grimshawi TaxID=7222 RepID=B4J8R8_DROGR|nr:uncharacterized protein LOC6559888 [Drosophila grimshawi]EDW02358.1 GH19939 [Drosophila grimshawi]
MWRFICLTRLLLWCSVVCLVCGALDELEYDADVAPPVVAPRPTLNLWHSFVVQMRQALKRFQPTTKQPHVRLRSTTPETDFDYNSTPDQQFYGALNPIYQTLNF